MTSLSLLVGRTVTHWKHLKSVLLRAIKSTRPLIEAAGQVKTCDAF